MNANPTEPDPPRGLATGQLADSPVHGEGAVGGEPRAAPAGAADTSGSAQAAPAGAADTSGSARAAPTGAAETSGSAQAAPAGAGGDSAVATAPRDPGAGAAPPDPTEKKKGKKRRGGDSPGKRERILRAAAELFAGKDYHRVLIDEVARRAEVGKGTVYRHFETKEDLFVAVLSYAVDLATERLRAKIERASDPVEQLRVACKQALRFFRENDNLFHVLNHEKALRCAKGRGDLNEKRKALRHFVEDVLVDGCKEGVFAPGDAAFASTILWGMIRTTLRTSPSDATLDEMSDKIVALYTRGILRRGAGRP